MEINQSGIDLIVKYESFSAKPYLDPVGIPTIGYGSTYYEDGTRVKMSDPSISKKRAEILFTYVLSETIINIKRYLKVKLTSNQFSAIVSLVYNIGIGNFSTSTLLRLLNKGNFSGAADQFLVWNKARVNGKLKVLNGLTKRRAEERALFLK
jgi:lysozyme